MAKEQWNDTYVRLFRETSIRVQSGLSTPAESLLAAEIAFLEQNGISATDFLADVALFCNGGTLSPSTSLLVAAVRRDYFLIMQQGQAASTAPLTEGDLPDPNQDFSGCVCLPRILAKAVAKLHGTLPKGVHFPSKDDLSFLSRYYIHPADFLRTVWATRADSESTLEALLLSKKIHEP